MQPQDCDNSCVEEQRLLLFNGLYLHCTGEKDELLNQELTDQKLWELTQHITRTAMVRSLAITGLKMEGHIVDSCINDNFRSIEAAHECLKVWRLGEQNSQIACARLIEALKTAGLSNLVHILTKEN